MKMEKRERVFFVFVFFVIFLGKNVSFFFVSLSFSLNSSTVFFLILIRQNRRFVEFFFYTVLILIRRRKRKRTEKRRRCLVVEVEKKREMVVVVVAVQSTPSFFPFSFSSLLTRQAPSRPLREPRSSACYQAQPSGRCRA